MSSRKSFVAQFLIWVIIIIHQITLGHFPQLESDNHYILIMKYIPLIALLLLIFSSAKYGIWWTVVFLFKLLVYPLIFIWFMVNYTIGRISALASLKLYLLSLLTYFVISYVVFRHDDISVLWLYYFLSYFFLAVTIVAVKEVSLKSLAFIENIISFFTDEVYKLPKKGENGLTEKYIKKLEKIRHSLASGRDGFISMVKMKTAVFFFFVPYLFLWLIVICIFGNLYCTDLIIREQEADVNIEYSYCLFHSLSIMTTNGPRLYNGEIEYNQMITCIQMIIGALMITAFVFMFTSLSRDYIEEVKNRVEGKFHARIKEIEDLTEGKKPQGDNVVSDEGEYVEYVDDP